MTPVERCREEQRRCAENLLANGRDRGAELGLADWAMEEILIMEQLKAPFPWFGGKSRVAAEVWTRFGEVPNYVEPFFGSGAVLLARLHEPRIETVNDADCYLTNFWRAVRADPAAVARYADYPVSELDQNARHLWLVSNAELRERMNTDPDWYDPKAAGWWVWGQNIWIGTGWCDSRFYRDGNAGRGIHRQLPHLGNAGRGIHRQLPHLGNAGTGIHRKLPHLGDAGKGVNRSQANIEEWLTALQARLRRVRIACGDWKRVVTPSVTTKHGLTAVFLDPPYATENDGTYSVNTQVAHEVANWCRENGDNPLLRIALCGYADEHALPGWRSHRWKQRKGYQKTEEDGTHSGHEETIWFSPACLVPQPTLFET